MSFAALVFLWCRIHSRVRYCIQSVFFSPRLICKVSMDFHDIDTFEEYSSPHYYKMDCSSLTDEMMPFQPEHYIGVCPFQDTTSGGTQHPPFSPVILILSTW